MKIGILTLPLHFNYGGLLQNYALQQVLKQMGLQVETINYSRKKDSTFLRLIKKTSSFIKRKIVSFFFPHRILISNYSLTDEEISYIRKNTDYFIQKYISCTDTIHTSKEFRKIARSNIYQGYVVGSDQCWRSSYNSFIKEMFLHFARNQKRIKRIAYAVSFGTNKWEMSSRLTKECAKLAKKFDLVTVREDNGVDLCKNFLGVNALHVVDPTMLLEKEDYIKLVEQENEPQSSGNLFYYILDTSEEKMLVIKDVAEKMKYTPFTVFPKYQTDNKTKEFISCHINECVYPTVTSWLRAFMDAEMIIVDSFHGMVFSIIFNKPFWVIGNSRRGNVRFESLLKTMGLEDRMINPHDCSAMMWEKPINWSHVNEIRMKEKTRCLNLFSKALNQS